MSHPKPYGLAEISRDNLRFDVGTGTGPTIIIEGSVDDENKVTIDTLVDRHSRKILLVRVIADADIALDETTTVIQGVALNDGDIVLATTQADMQTNRPYVVSLAGGAWVAISTNSADWRFCMALEGTHAGILYELANVNPDPIGSGIVISYIPIRASVRPGSLRIGSDFAGDLLTTDLSIADGKVTLAKLDNSNTAVDGQLLSYDQASGRFKWVTVSSGASGSGTVNRVAYWSGTSSLAASRIDLGGTKGIVEVLYQSGDTRPAIYGGDPDNVDGNQPGVFGGSYNSIGVWGRSVTGTCILARQEIGATGCALDIDGSEAHRQVIVSSTYSVLPTDHTILVDTSGSGGPIGIALPAQTSNQRKLIRIIDVGLNASNRPILIATQGGETFWDGAVSKAITVDGDGAEFRAIGDPPVSGRTWMAHSLPRHIY